MKEIFYGINIKYQINYADILNQYSNSFLNQLLSLDVFIAAYLMHVYLYTRKIETPSYIDIIQGVKVDKNTQDIIILKSGSLIALILALFVPIIIIGYKTGWYS